MPSVIRSYLFEILVKYKYWLGGGSLILIALAITEKVFRYSVAPITYLFLTAFGLVAVLFQYGLEQHRKLIPKLLIRPKVLRHSYPTPKGPDCGTTWYIEVFNESWGQSIEDVRVSLVKLSPSPQGVLSLFIRELRNMLICS